MWKCERWTILKIEPTSEWEKTLANTALTQWVDSYLFDNLSNVYPGFVNIFVCS